MANHTFTGVFIPAKIWLAKDLIPQEKMMLAEIRALSEDNGWCFANNSHFSKWLGCGTQNISNYIKRFEREGMIEVTYTDKKTFAGRKMRVNVEWFHGLATPYTGNVTPYTGNVTEIHFKDTSKPLESAAPAPAENFNNLEEEKNEKGLVAPPPAEIQRPDPHQSQGQMIGPIVEYIASNPSDIKVTYPPAEASAPGCPYCAAGITHKAGEGCDPTHIVRTTGPGSPGVMEVEGIALAPNPRVATTIEAEKRISDWIVGEGLETVRFRYETAKERFDPQQAQAISAHYCSVYTKNPANKERLLKDPVTHFSDGLFAYIKSEQQYGRHRPQPSASAQTTQSPAVLTPSQYRRLT